MFNWVGMKLNRICSSILSACAAAFAATQLGVPVRAQAPPATPRTETEDIVTKPGRAEIEALAQSAQRAWKEMPRILRRISPPRFPAHRVDVRTFGAVGDGQTDCTDAFKAAIDACSKAGGGTVLVPGGTYLTGPIHLKSGVNLHVSAGATILFSPDTNKYLPVVFARYEGTELMNFSPLIYAFEQRNIALTGRGTLDARQTAAVWHQWARLGRADNARLAELANNDAPVSERVFGPGHLLRPNFVQFVRCQNVLIEGIKIFGSPMWVINPVYCTNVTVRGVTVQAEGPNTDGCNPDSSTDVLIENCYFSNGDDCIAIKSGRDHDGRRVGIPSQNIVIRNCVFKDGHGGVTVGSETAGGVRNVFAENCRFDSPNLDMAIRFKTNPARGGFIENCYIRNCTINTAKVGIHMTMRYGSSGAREGAFMPLVRNIDIRNCTFERLLDRAIFIEGHSHTGKIESVTIANCRFKPAPNPSIITNATAVRLVNTTGAGLD